MKTVIEKIKPYHRVKKALRHMRQQRGECVKRPAAPVDATAKILAAALRLNRNAISSQLKPIDIINKITKHIGEKATS